MTSLPEKDPMQDNAVVEDGQVKFGLKKRHVRLPDGWHIVRKGNCLLNDKFLNLRTGFWEIVDDTDVGLDHEDNFAVLIRKDDVVPG